MADLKKLFVNEKELRFYDLTFTDQNGTQIAKSGMSALTITLFLKGSNPISYINSRNAINAFDANNVTIATDGKITWAMQAADNTIQDTNQQVEIHVAVFHLTTSSGVQVRDEAYFYVDNLEPVT